MYSDRCGVAVNIVVYLVVVDVAGGTFSIVIDVELL